MIPPGRRCMSASVAWEIAPNRIQLEEPSPHVAFLAAYSRADIALETFPCNGGTTTAEALWQGCRCSRSMEIAGQAG